LATNDFRREPWPVQLSDGAWIFHCLAGPEAGEVTGSRFLSGG